MGEKLKAVKAVKVNRKERERNRVVGKEKAA